MATTRRKHGTETTAPESGEERVAALRRIVAQKQYAMIDGTMIDLFTASLVVQVHDALSPTNQTKYASMPARRMAEVALSISARAT